MLKVDPCPRPVERSGKSVRHTSTETSLPQSSRSKLSRRALAGSSSCLYLSVSLETTSNELKMSTFTTTILNLLYAEAEKKGKIRNFRMYVGPGSDASSADKVSLDLKFNPWDAANTFQPERRSMSKTAFKQYDPCEIWYTCQGLTM